MSEKVQETTTYEPPKVVLGNLPHSIMEETHDFVNEHGFTSCTMELLLMASTASEKMRAAIGALGDLEKSKAEFLRRKENLPTNTSSDSQTEGRLE